jgi:hypothetical protein
LVSHSGDAPNGVFHVVKEPIHPSSCLVEIVHGRSEIFQSDDESLNRATSLLRELDSFGDRINAA